MTFDPDPAFDAAFDKLAKELGMKTELHLQVEERQAAQQNARSVQIGGDHYKKLAIQPFEYNTANGIGFAEGCAIKYLTRWKDKGGIEDLRKARHFIDMLIERETGNGQPHRSHPRTAMAIPHAPGPARDMRPGDNRAYHSGRQAAQIRGGQVMFWPGFLAGLLFAAVVWFVREVVR